MTTGRTRGRGGTSVDTDDVIAYRLHAHGLSDRRSLDRLHEAAGACAIQNSPPGSALLALGARVDDVTEDHFDRLVGRDKSLLQTWSLRGAPYFFPTVDADVFTAGVLPTSQRARLQLIVGVEQALTGLGVEVDEMTDLTASACLEVLPGRQLAINELGAEVAQRMAVQLTPTQQIAWRGSSPYGANVSLGEAVVHFCLRLVALRAVVCLAPRTRNKAPFVLLEEWLDNPLPSADPTTSRLELLRRYLHCYGPSTRQEFASWVGVRPGDVGPWWDPLVDELVPVDFAGRATWLLVHDLDALRSSPEAVGVRLLPPGDPFTQLRDKGTIVAKEHQRDVWKTIGTPGTVLVDGRIVGTWRQRKTGKKLAVSVTPFQALGGDAVSQLRDEAERVAGLRGAAVSRVEVT